MWPGHEARPGGWSSAVQSSELLPSGEGAWVLGGLCTTHLKTRKLDSMSTKMTPFSDTLQFLPLAISIASSGLFQGSLADTVAIILLLLALPV